MTTISNLQEQLAKHQAEAAKLQKQLEMALSESPEKQLARELHDLSCGWNHTDGCSWYYEPEEGKNAWTGHAHSDYLARARKLIHKCDIHGVSTKSAIEMYKIVRGY